MLTTWTNQIDRTWWRTTGLARAAREGKWSMRERTATTTGGEDNVSGRRWWVACLWKRDAVYTSEGGTWCNNLAAYATAVEYWLQRQIRWLLVEIWNWNWMSSGFLILILGGEEDHPSYKEDQRTCASRKGGTQKKYIFIIHRCRLRTTLADLRTNSSIVCCAFLLFSCAC